MATQEASEDFDLAGVNASDGDDDFDWASLDEPEQQPASGRGPAAFTAKAGAIPFQDTAAPPAAAAATMAIADAPPGAQAACTQPAAVSSQPSIATKVGGSSPSQAPIAHVDRPVGTSPSRAVASTPAARPPAPPAKQGAANTPSAAMPPGRPSHVASAATPPAPRYSARPAAASPAVAGAGPGGHASPATVHQQTSPSTPQQVQSPPTGPGQGAANRPQAALKPHTLAGTILQAATQGAAQQTETAGPSAPAGQHTAAEVGEPAAVQTAELVSSQPPTSQQAATGHTSPAAGTSSSSSSVVVSEPRGGGGWGWGLGGLSSKLQQVALGAAKDLQELTASVQQAVAEVVAADDVSEVDKLAAYQAHPPRPPAASAVASTAPPAAMAASRDSQGQLPTIHEPDDHEEGAVLDVPAGASAAAAGSDESRRLQVLHRLQGQDTQLETGLKVIDDQVDMLAASAAKALGSLWGGFSNVAKTSWTVGQALTTKVEAAAKEVAKELAVGLEEGAAAVAPVTTLAERLAATAERGLESVGRVGAALLDPAFTPANDGDAHHRHTPSDWTATFDSCFELYGGSQAAEELEQLSSECAGICNRARATLQQQHREQIDRTLAQLVPAFDLRSQQPQQQQQSAADDDHSASQRQQQQVEVSDAMQDGLDHMYLPVVALCNKGKHKARQVQQEAESAAADAVAEDSAAAAAAGGGGVETGSGAEAAEGQGQAEIQPAAAAPSDITTSGDKQGKAGHTAPNSGSKVEALLAQLLSSLRSAAVKSLAEVSAGQLMMLLALGRSVAAVPRYGKPLDDGLEWPVAPDQVAAIMRQQVQLMMDDTQQLAGTFKAAAPQLLTVLLAACSKVAAAAGASSAVAQILSSEAAQQQASLVVEEVAVDCNTAVRHLTDGFGKLLYVVLLSSLHQAGKPAVVGGDAQMNAEL